MLFLFFLKKRLFFEHKYKYIRSSASPPGSPSPSSLQTCWEPLGLAPLCSEACYSLSAFLKAAIKSGKMKNTGRGLMKLSFKGADRASCRVV